MPIVDCGGSQKLTIRREGNFRFKDAAFVDVDFTLESIGEEMNSAGGNWNLQFDTLKCPHRYCTDTHVRGALFFTTVQMKSFPLFWESSTIQRPNPCHRVNVSFGSFVVRAQAIFAARSSLGSCRLLPLLLWQLSLVPGRLRWSVVRATRSEFGKNMWKSGQSGNRP